MVDIVAAKENAFISKVNFEDLRTLKDTSLKPVMTIEQLRAAALNIHSQVEYAEVNLLFRKELMGEGTNNKQAALEIVDSYNHTIFKLCERQGISQIADQASITNILRLATTTVARQDMNFQGIPGLPPLDIPEKTRPAPARTPAPPK